MCGINGYYSYSEENNAIFKQKHFSILESMKYRGPDSSEYFNLSNDLIGLYASELKINEISRSHQPFNYNDKIYSIINGEIYNRCELNDLLLKKGIKLGSLCDNEVLSALYDQYGEACFSMIKGMFALAIYDKDKGDLILARDRFGEKPLFYFNDGKGFHFCSEANFLIDFTNKVISKLGLVQYFSFGFAFDHIIEGIKRIYPGEYLIIHKSTIRKRRYFNPSFLINRSITENECIDQSLTLLREAVDLMIPEEVQYGSYISGGIDSSVITLLLKEKNNSFDLFTSGLIANILSTPKKGLVDNDYAFVETVGNELAFTDELAKVIPGKYNRISFSVSELIKYLPDMVNHLPGGPVISTSFPLFYFSALHSKGTKVCFSGEGADELNGGYATLQPELFSDSISESFFKLSDYSSVAEIHKMFGDEGVNLLNDFCRSLDKEIQEELLCDSVDTMDYKFNKIRHFHLKYIFGSHLLEKADGMTMGKGPTELRMPFLYSKYAEFISTIPLNILKNTGQKKRIIYEIGKKLNVPSKIASRIEKQRTSLPYNYLFSNNPDFITYTKKYFNESALINSITNCKIDSLIYEACSTKNSHKRLWSYFILEIWLNNNLLQK